MYYLILSVCVAYGPALAALFLFSIPIRLVVRAFKGG